MSDWLGSGPVERSDPLSRREEIHVPPPVLVAWSIDTERGQLSVGTGPPPWQASKSEFGYTVAWGPAICLLHDGRRHAGEQWHALRQEGMRGELAGIPIRVNQPKFGLRKKNRALRVEAEDGRVWVAQLDGFVEYVVSRVGESEPVYRGPWLGLARRHPVAWRRDALDDEIVLGASLESIAILMTLLSRSGL